METKAIKLNKGEIYTHSDETHNLVVSVQKGRVWLTQTGLLEDVVLEGSQHRSFGHGKMVFEAIADHTLLEVTCNEERLSA